jgi:NAD(P)-dependent dehydrogenase (short-subunit alcohol dehydrogenase family)
MDIRGKSATVLGGFGLVGSAVCRELLRRSPRRLVLTSLRREEAEGAVRQLQAEFPGSPTEIVAAWGDVLLRAEWQDPGDAVQPRMAVLADPDKRRRLVADILNDLDEEILGSSLLVQLLTGVWPGLRGEPADIVVDCVNTATAVAYQNIFLSARKLQSHVAAGWDGDSLAELERLLSSLYIPILVRHMQILYESLRRAHTAAYVKVGTSGTGGMGFNIPYTHGEERPSRLVLSKSAVAGAQTMLLFLMARTPGGPAIVKEIKPTAAIAWKEIGFGTIRRGGKAIPVFDCLPEQAYSLDDPRTLEPGGDFGRDVGRWLEAVYIDTGENGMFAAAEFAALTTLGQMSFVTPEEIARNVVVEIEGGNTGRDVVAALDGAVMGPSYRAGVLRGAARERLRQLQAEHHSPSLAFEILGPPRLAKLIFEAHLVKRVGGDLRGALDLAAERLAARMWAEVEQSDRLRQEILSVGIPILLPDGRKILRGPLVHSANADQGWVDLTPGNAARWQTRMAALRAYIKTSASDSTSRIDRAYPSLVDWSQGDEFDEGEVVGWLFNHEDMGGRGKS